MEFDFIAVVDFAVDLPLVLVDPDGGVEDGVDETTDEVGRTATVDDPAQHPADFRSGNGRD